MMFFGAMMSPPPIGLTQGLVLHSSAQVRRGDYHLPTAEGTTRAGDETLPALTQAVTVKGDGITVDFHGATLWGSDPSADPDQRHGLGLRVLGNHVTIKNLNVRGYRFGLIAEGCRDLKIVACDFSYNYKPHLSSTPEREDESDWQSYHHNEHNEWLRYGAGLYLRECEKFEVRDVRVESGLCGLMLSNCRHGLVWNNDFSFNSGLGIGMYRSSENRIMHNRVDWDVRGFSYGVYNRGQDSAGILIFEQCTRNVFAYNSVTHGGDGFFLWAGQQTMDSGKGGCNDNVAYGNDFSHAPTNGIEATFSRNLFANNLVLECWHGVWGGYSYDTKIIGNRFGYNAQGIAIEHGQSDLISGNQFERDYQGVGLWQNASQDPNWGYPKGHDTVSRDTVISDNVFTNTSTEVLSVRDSTRIALTNNLLLDVGEGVKTTGSNPGLTVTGNHAFMSKTPANVDATSNEVVIAAGSKPEPATMQPSGLPVPPVDVAEYERRFHSDWNPYLSSIGVSEANGIVSRFAGLHAKAQLTYRIPPLRGGQNPFLPKSQLRGQRYILVDEWGPYDFRRPILVARSSQNLAGEANVTRKRFELLGPAGTWRIKSQEGFVNLSAKSGTVPGFVDADLPAGRVGQTSLQLVYQGKATTDAKGITTPAGQPVQFGYSTFFAPIDWNVQFFRWSQSENPAEPHANPAHFDWVMNSIPIRKLRTDRLDLSGPSFLPGMPSDHYATRADGEFTVPPGEYTLSLTTDDGARVWVDDKLVIADAWKYQGPTVYTANLQLGGRHHIRVEHFQIDGYAALKVELRPRRR